VTFAVADRAGWCLPELLGTQAHLHADRPFLSFALGERDLTYAETAAEADVVAAGLARLGVRHGDRVLLMMRNRAEFVLSWLGAARLGAVQVPINVDYRGPFFEHLVNTAAATVLIVEDALLDTLTASAGKLEHLRTVVVVGDAPAHLPGTLEIVAFSSLVGHADDTREAAAVAPSDVGAIHFTSGTSGPSKGAVLPHAHLHLLSERNRELLDLRTGDTYLTELPLFHINAQMSVYSALLVGARVRIEQRFSASSWLDRVRASNATHTSLLGVMLAFILKQPARPEDADTLLRRAWSVPCPPDLATAFRDRFGLEEIVTSYGSTEVGRVARRTLDAPPGSVGRVDPDLYAARVVDEQAEDVPPGEVGELLVRPLLPWTTTQGYFGMPERTLEAFRDLWFHTGDAARLDDDGNLWFVDRIKDRIRRRGENIASVDVENVLLGHPAIADAAVVAVQSDEEGGEDEIKAVVVAAPGAELDPEAVWAWCEETLPYFAVPRYVEILPELPKTPTAKVRKSELRDAGVTPLTNDRGPARSGRGRR
jgi:crotonobetaine/carnitine-CoA ligase